MRIAVAGGTGQVGKLVVDAARERGHEPVVIARSTGVDLTTGAGLEAALDGVEVIIDVSNVTTTSRAKAVAFFETVTSTLLNAAAKAGTKHHIALSIVGCDRVGLGYYAGKMRQEELVLNGAVPATVLRATQFHEFAGQLLSGVPGPIAIVPSMRVQPIAVREVAEALADLVLDKPQAMAPEIAGPRVESLVDMARRLIAAGGARQRPVLPLPLPGAMSSGGLIPQGPGPRGTETFTEWLQRR